jgi:hypothetical protein
VERWLEAESRWSSLRDQFTQDRWMELRYESLVRDPESQLEVVCGFLGVSYDARMLEYPSTTSYSAPDPSLADRWKRALSERELGLVEQRVGALLIECGYIPSGVSPIDVSPQMERRLRRQDRLARVRFRIARYGFPLIAAEYAFRFLGLDTLHARVMLRMHAITRRHLR